MQTNPISRETPMWSLEFDHKDWLTLDKSQIVKIYFLLLAARRFEETISDLDRRGLVHGPAHSSIGQEGGAAGCIAAMPPEALITGTHRAHHQAVCKALQALWPDNSYIGPRMTKSMSEALTSLLADILGLEAGWSGGRGGSMHLRRDDLGIMGTNAIVAGGMPLACGLAWSEKSRGTGNMVATFLGDGAIHQGTAYEAMNLAALYRLPLLFFIENNRYSVSTSIEQSTFEQELLTRAFAQGIPSAKVDGMNPLSVHMATRWALDQMRETSGPVLLQADVYRYFHQSVAYPGSAFGYRSKEEESAWKLRDPVDFMQRELLEAGILGEPELAEMDEEVKSAVQTAVDFCIEGKGSRACIRPERWPSPETVDDGITGDLSELTGLTFMEREEAPLDGLEELDLLSCIPAVMQRAMEEDSRIFILGEDVANMGGGTVGATKGLIDAFPGRVVNTPISENGFCGLAAGAAMGGLKPVVELMYSDFVLNAADQLFNQTAKLRHLFGGQYAMPLVLRCRVPGPEGYGSQHSMDPAGLFALYPGWRIVAPSNAYDYVGLMNTALRCNDPVLVIEHQSLHKSKCLVPRDLNYFIPLGKARRVREGDQLTLVATLTMVDLCVDVLDEMGVSADVIDLRTLSLRDIDYETIGNSLIKTNNIAIVEQTTRGTSLGAHLVDGIQSKFFDYLDQPVKRVVGKWASPTVSKELERHALASRADLEAQIRELLVHSGQTVPDDKTTDEDRS